MEFFSQIAAVAAVLGLLGASVWWLRKRGFASVAPGVGRAGRRIQCLERLALGPQHSLHLVRFGERALLVACSPAGCSLLDSERCGEPGQPRESLS